MSLRTITPGQVHDLQDVYTEYLDARRDPWLEAFAKLKLMTKSQLRELSEQTGLSLTMLRAARAGRRPHPKNRAKLLAALKTELRPRAQPPLAEPLRSEVAAMLRFMALLALLLGLASTPIAVAHQQTAAVVAYAQIPMFTTEAAAQRHCPTDQVVWLNIPSGIYHLKGMRWYGRTEHGAYVCRREADAAGYRETRNGQ